LLRHLGDYDVVHMASFPYFPLLAVSALRRRSGYRLVVDWHEVWSLAYWRRYAGSLVGTIGAAWKLSTCPLRYALWRPELGAMSRVEPLL